MKIYSEFGPELRRLREAAGISLRQFAECIYYSKSYVSRVETGTRRPSPEFVRLCDAELAAGGALAALGRSVAVSESGREEPAGVEEEVWHMTFEPDGRTGFLPINRRGVLALGATAVLGLTLAPVGGATDHLAVLTLHRAQYDHVRALGQVSGPTYVFPLAIQHTHTLRGLARGAPREAAGALRRLAAQYAVFAGWMAQEADDPKMAAWCTETAVELATAGGDTEMAHYALIRHANLAMYRHDATTTITLARRAQADPSVSPRVRGLAAQREAQGYAMAGEHDECLRALDRSTELLAVATADTAGGPTLGTSTVADPAAMATGWCLLELGRPREAGELLDREVARLPATASRARTRWGTIRALAHAGGGEVDHACELTHALLDDAAAVDSATIRQDLDRLGRLLTRWRTHPPVRELRPRLTAALHR